MTLIILLITSERTNREKLSDICGQFKTGYIPTSVNGTFKVLELGDHDHVMSWGFCLALEVDTVLTPLWEAPASVQADRALLIRLVFLTSLDCFTFWIQSELPERTLLRSLKLYNTDTK